MIEGDRAPVEVMVEVVAGGRVGIKACRRQATTRSVFDAAKWHGRSQPGTRKRLARNCSAGKTAVFQNAAVVICSRLHESWSRLPAPAHWRCVCKMPFLPSHCTSSPVPACRTFLPPKYLVFLVKGYKTEAGNRVA